MKKGGTGKSTLATNLAAYRHQVTGSNNILIIDTDVQGSASDWCYYRTEAGVDGIESIQLFGKKILSEIKSKKRRYDDIIIDAGGRDSKELRASMVVADVMLVPIRASQYDIATVERLDQMLEEVRATINPNLVCWAIVNGLKSHPQLPEWDEAQEALSEFENIQLIEFPVYDRIAYSRSGYEGFGVTESLDSDNKAIKEIKKLHNQLYGEVQKAAQG